MVAFPAFKLGALLLKQISKPLANVVKARARTSPFFRTYICMPPAQFYHWCDVRMKMWTMNLGKPVTVAPLNENMAIELGADLLGEGIIFTIAAAILTFEYVRSTRKEHAKEYERKEQFERIQNELKDLYFARAKQETQLRELIRALHVINPSLNYHEPMSIDTNDIPEHHKQEVVVGDGTSIFTKMNNLLWSAVEFIVPPVEDSPSKTEPGTVSIILVEVPNDPKHSSCPPTSQASPALALPENSLDVVPKV